MQKQNDFKGEEHLKKSAGENNMVKYVYAYDPKIQRRVVHIVKKGSAISLVTGHSFKYNGPVSSTRQGR